MATIEDVILTDKEKTFQYDKDLLILPVPDLGHTLNKYLASVRPLVTDQEYRQTEFIVQQFASGEGKYLHEKLKEKARHERNWLAEWWEDWAYLEVRLPAPLMNMAGPGPYHEDVWQPQPGSQLPRAALGLYYTLKFWQYIRQERHKPMKDAKGRPQCMYQYKRIFNTCNIPGVSRDKLVSYLKTESEGPCPHHIVVMSKGHIFIMNPFDESQQILSPPELEEQLRQIKQRSEKLGPAQGVTYLTALERTAWAQARNRLIALDPNNSRIVKKIDTAIMSVWLESGDGGSVTDDLANKALLGNGENRWFDKSLSFGVYENGMCISNADHTPAEGIMLVYLTSYIHAKLLECKGQWQGSLDKRPVPEPELEQFVLDSHLKKLVEKAKNDYAVMRQCATAHIEVFSKFGKKLCKQIKIHPDAFCQLAMQLAFYMTYGKMAPTYETAPIKQFYHGRTETLRSCTMECKAWCEAMLNPSVSNPEKRRLLQVAGDKHLQEFLEACEFRACDRHLIGLSIICREEGRELPMLYKDISYTKSGGGGNFLLSTSCIGYTQMIGAVLPMCQHGIGTFYRINEDRFSFYITTWNADKSTSSHGFGAAVSRALDMMGTLIQQQMSTTPARL